MYIYICIRVYIYIRTYFSCSANTSQTTLKDASAHTLIKVKETGDMTVTDILAQVPQRSFRNQRFDGPNTFNRKLLNKTTIPHMTVTIKTQRASPNVMI